MKKSREIIDLPIVGIVEGTRLGKVKGLLVNPARKRIQFVLANVSDQPGEVLVLPFERVVGIGEHALTIESRATMEDISRMPEAVELLLKNVQVTGLAVMDNKGTLRGTVSEYMVDEATGAITGCFLAADQAGGLIPAAAIITYSPSYVIVNEDFALVEEGKVPAAPEPAAAPAEPPGEKNGFDSFVGRQREFLTGRTVTADILDDEGRIVAREGESITEELIEKVIAADKYIELTMSTR